MDETLKELGETIVAALPDSALDFKIAFGELTVAAKAADIVKVMAFLRDDERCRFVSFIDVTAVDWPKRENRFDGVYHLLSPKRNLRVRVTVETDEVTPVPSVVAVLP